MKKTIIWSTLLVTLALLIAQLWWSPSSSRLHEGDIVFRGTGYGVAALTLSPWTHCGVLVQKNGQWYVYEAIGPVKMTPLHQWKRSPYIYRVMRPKTPLTDAQLRDIRQRLNQLSGRRYDKAYSWSDDKLYCSELVWKAYQSAGIRLSEPRRIDTFLTYHILPQSARNRLIRRKGLSTTDPMVPPCDLIRSSLLRRVW